MAASREALGDRWLDVYLTSPAWRFTGEAGACGPVPVVGLMVPSVDRVGRYFPLTIVAELPSDASLLGVTALAPFFETAERLMIETLESEYVDFESFDQRVVHLVDHLSFLSVPQPVVLERGRPRYSTAADRIAGRFLSARCRSLHQRSNSFSFSN